MPVIDVTRDPEALRLTFTCEFAAPAEAVWQLWADNEKLGRWWGPPEWPATFPAFRLAPGERVHYWMTGPDGEQSHGHWIIDTVDEPRSLSFRDGFADADGAPQEELGLSTCDVSIEATESGSRMVLASGFESLEQFEQLMQMQMDVGMSMALGQIDAILAEG